MQPEPPRRADRTAFGHFRRHVLELSAQLRGTRPTHPLFALLSILMASFAVNGISFSAAAQAQYEPANAMSLQIQNGRDIALLQNTYAVSIDSLSPSPIGVGQALTIRLRITPAYEGPDRLLGGVQIFDPSDSRDAHLHAFAFHTGNATANAVSYTVPADLPIPRTIRVAIN